MGQILLSRAKLRQPCMTEAAFLFGELAVSGSENGNGASVMPLNSRSDETWLPEWSGKLGGVKRWRSRSHLTLEGASLADKRAEIAP